MSVEIDSLTLLYPQFLSPVPSDIPSQSGLRLSSLDPDVRFHSPDSFALMSFCNTPLTKLQTLAKYFHNIY